ncbi:MAG: hypothetical protein IJD72_07375 [Alistipes sp.]|nr:hypothetical protein [Alistipes sp.]
MSIKQPAENTIRFAKNRITIYLTKAIYDTIEKIARTRYSDARSIKGVIEIYAVIQLYSRLGFTNTFVPIHKEIFQYISKRNYIAYRELLCKNDIIEYRKGEYTQYQTESGEHRISSTTTEYRMAGIIGVLFDNDKTIPVHIDLPSEYIAALKKKHELIGKAYLFSEGKRRSIMDLNAKEIEVVELIKTLIIDIISQKITTKRTLDKRISHIESIDNKTYFKGELFDLIKRLVRVSNNKHIAGNNLSYLFDMQSDKQNIKNGLNLQFYQNLRANIGAYEECLTKRDLIHISRINTIPNYGTNDKIYSALANIRKPIREHITYQGELLVEASDVSCAHFTMLPIIFKRYNITIPNDELQRWIDLTQTQDLYSAVVEGAKISRSEIKAIFQPFLSIKNKNQFLYGHEGNERIYREAVCEFFEERFPAIFKALLSWHTVTDESIKSVANRVESDIMNPICNQLIAEGLHPFRIHDAIYLPKNELSKLTIDIRSEVMSSINREML